MVKITLNAATAEQLATAIANYMNEYHPAGYGTTVDKQYEKDGVFYAEISRYSSCD
jgi:hypothetical protein